MDDPDISEEEKQGLNKSYKNRGFQQVSLKEYLVIQAETEKRANKKIPKSVKVLISIPLYIIAAVGLFLIPFFMYQVFTSPIQEEPAKKKKKSSVTYEQLMKKKSKRK